MQMAKAQDMAFAKRAVALLKQKYPKGYVEAGIKPEEEITTMYQAITAAKSYGMQYENDIMLYLELIFYLGLNFDKNPKTDWTNKILTNQNLSGEAKMNALYEQLVFSGS